MKTSFKSKFFIAACIAICFSILPLWSVTSGQGKDALTNDTTSVVTISGRISDKVTGKPLIFASIFLEGTNIGTVSNSDGDFVIKIPKKSIAGSLGVTHLGYKNFSITISSITSPVEFKVESQSIPLAEVTIFGVDANKLLKSALEKVPENYDNNAAMYTSFYRESIKQNRSYVSVGEAVLTTYKAPYSKNFEPDRVKIFKGRKSNDVKKMDTVLFKLEGGPLTAYMLDIAKNPENLFTEDFENYYNLTIDGQIVYNDHLCYVVAFDQKPNVSFPLYKGKVYISINDLAIAGLEFSLSPIGINKASEMLIRKKPISMKVETKGANYLVNYSQRGGKWFLTYVRSELIFKTKWKRKLFYSNFIVSNEMAVTDISSENVIKYPRTETARLNDVFAEKVSAFQDTDFWGNYNYIKPDENIETAIEKLNKKMIRNQ